MSRNKREGKYAGKSPGIEWAHYASGWGMYGVYRNEPARHHRSWYRGLSGLV